MPSKHAFSISLTEHLAAFIKTAVAEGRYSTASEVVRAGLRLLEEQSLRSGTPAAGMNGSNAAPRARANGHARAATRTKP